MARRAHRTTRLIAVLVVAIAFSPGLVWRAPPIADRGSQPLHVAPLAKPAPGTRLASGMVVAGAWHLSSRGEAFGGYSALLALPGGKFLALSDRGWFLRFDDPTRTRTAAVAGTVGAANDSDKRLFDIEAATRDPASDILWLAYESTNTIRRYGPDLTDSQGVQPVRMRNWPSNRGPEAMVRLTDGRFVVLSEAVGEGPRPASQGLLFAGDPLDSEEPQPFRFVPPPGFRPTDIAQLPDGRVVILLRALQIALPPRIASRLIVADPAEIEPGGEWAWRPLAAIRAPLPRENYEGLAIEPLIGGAVRLWLISDDNGAALQRTLLLALDWTPPKMKKARGPAARP
jgi:hypothetical protein